MAGYIGSKSSVTQVDGYSEAEADAEFVTKTGDTMTGDLNLGANSLSLGANNANSPQILFENSDGVTGDAALSTYDDASGTMLVMGSNFYINSSGSETRFNTSEESSAVMLNRNGDLNLLTGGTGATATTRLKIDSSGNVGIGNTSSGYVFTSGETRLSVGNGANHSAIQIYSGANQWGGLEFADDATNGQGQGLIGYYHPLNYMQFSTAATERMRIHAEGDVLIGQTTQTNGHGKIQLSGRNGHHCATFKNGNDGGYGLVFRNTSASQVGTITWTGSSTSFNTSSDYRLKENVVDLTGASARVNQLNPSRFNWIADETNTLVDGFLAHEVATVVPEAINGTKDAMKDEEYEVTPAVEATYDEDGNELTAAVEAVMGTRSVPDYQGIDQSKLVPLLTAALQEALTEIASLKTRVEALEA